MCGVPEGSLGRKNLCPSHGCSLEYLREKMPEHTYEVEIMFCPRIDCNHVEVPSLKFAISGWAGDMAIFAVARQSAAHAKFVKHFVGNGK